MIIRPVSYTHQMCIRDRFHRPSRDRSPAFRRRCLSLSLIHI
ncbi:hypothetical protein [Sphingobium sp. B2]|nr:hypothetical protein [Sphingobium sp. B2]